MTSVYQLFKIVTGLIIGGFILYFLLSYAGTYAGTQEDIQRALIQRNFFRALQDAYHTGTPFGFTDLGRVTLDISIEPTEPAGIVTKLGKFPFPVPVIFVPADELFLYCSDLDLGWWKFRVVYAVPQTTILFAPLDASERTWNLIEKTVRSMPDTTGFEPKVTFGFCDGSDVFENFCGADQDMPCEQGYFLTKLSTLRGAVSPCTASLPQNRKLITIAPSCHTHPGVCAELPDQNGTGNLYIDGKFLGLYKDGLDIAAAVFGGTEKDIYGIGGEKLYVLKNRAFASRVGLAARTMAEGFRITAKKILSEVAAGKLSEESSTYTCLSFYNGLTVTLNELADFLESWDHTDYRAAKELLGRLEAAKAEYAELVNRGCEYVI